MKRMKERLDQTQKGRKRGDFIEGINNPPFTKEVLQVELPKDFRLLKLENYDGTGTPSIMPGVIK